MRSQRLVSRGVIVLKTKSVMDSKKIELVKKVKALAERGVGGEKEDAIKLLEKLMKKYGIEEADVSDEIEELHSFSYHGDFEHKLLLQVFYKHFPDVREQRGRIRVLPYGKGSRSTFFVSCTKAQSIEIAIEFDFYRELWNEEVKFFMSAFIQKHEIYPQDSWTHAETLSPEDALKMKMMMQGLSDRTLQPRIGSIDSYSSNGI